MNKRALIEHRPWLFASLAAALAFYFLWNNPISGLWLILLKGAGVGALAVYALRRTVGIDGAILVLVLALSAAADMALEITFELGGALFAASHVVASVLYLRNRALQPPVSRMLVGGVLLVTTPTCAYLLSGDVYIALYAVLLGAMAATAWTSRFALHQVGAGATLFVLSDWLLFSRNGPFDLGVLPDILIWPLYYSGQFLIATGVVQTLRGEAPAR